MDGAILHFFFRCFICFLGCARRIESRPDRELRKWRALQNFCEVRDSENRSFYVSPKNVLSVDSSLYYKNRSSLKLRDLMKKHPFIVFFNLLLIFENPSLKIPQLVCQRFRYFSLDKFEIRLSLTDIQNRVDVIRSCNAV